MLLFIYLHAFKWSCVHAWFLRPRRAYEASPKPPPHKSPSSKVGLGKRGKPKGKSKGPRVSTSSIYKGANSRPKAKSTRARKSKTAKGMRRGKEGKDQMKVPTVNVNIFVQRRNRHVSVCAYMCWDKCQSIFPARIIPNMDPRLIYLRSLSFIDPIITGIANTASQTHPSDGHGRLGRKIVGVPGKTVTAKTARIRAVESVAQATAP